MNNPKSKRPTGGTGMSSREIEASIRRIEDDLYFGSDNIMIRLTRIEEKLEHVVTRDDLKAFATRDDLKAFVTRDDLKVFATKEDLKAFATKDDLRAFATREDLAELRTEMIALVHTQFRWTIGVVVSCMGVILAVLKLT
ncbi:MAG: hypothetical protein OXI19_10155 [Gemmatimonadota bacterium]|nr:hypothetical protein [Gemmatimonadota bacterium]